MSQSESGQIGTYRNSDEEYEEVRLELLKTINRAKPRFPDAKKEYWAREMIEFMKQRTSDEAQDALTFFTTGVKSLKTEKKIEDLRRSMPWVLRTKGIICTHYSNEPTACLGIAAVFMRYAETLDLEVFKRYHLVDKMFGPALYYPTLEEAEAMRDEYAKKIFKHYHELQKILRHYERWINKRWHDMKQDKRENILKKNWEATYIDGEELQGTEKISTDHRMDIAVLLGWESAKKKGSHNQWPYISLKDLADKKTGILPLMLHSRANNPPGNFWNIDEGSWQASILSWDSWFPMLDGYGMIFGGQNTPEEYGRILKVDDKTRSGRGTHAAQGIPLLKIQARLYHFLVCCCVDIMHDQKQLEDLDNLPENPDPTVQLRPVPPEAIRQGFLDEPYHRIPIVIEDIDEILESLEERRAIAVDHLLSLRDDPTYFHMCLHELADHTPEMLKDQDGRRVPGFGSEEF